MNPQKQHEIFRRLQANNPEPETELNYQSHFELMIAVMLSAQSTDKKVNEVTNILFKKASSPEKMCALGKEKIQKIIKPINYYLTKTKHILKTCQILIDQHQSKVPQDRKDLEALPGIGRKTANVILNIAFNQPTIAVDTHIFRVSNRTGLAHGKTPLEVEKNLEKTIDPIFLSHAHHWLILHGRYICVARKPRCPSCPIQDLCEFEDKQI